MPFPATVVIVAAPVSRRSRALPVSDTSTLPWASAARLVGALSLAPLGAWPSPAKPQPSGGDEPGVDGVPAASAMVAVASPGLVTARTRQLPWSAMYSVLAANVRPVGMLSWAMAGEWVGPPSL